MRAFFWQIRQIKVMTAGPDQNWTQCRRFSVAPMMECTDRHARFFMRKLSARALLFTEMVHAGAVVYGDRGRFLDFDTSEHPVALQLGGSDPELLADATRWAERWGYDEVNLNVGCPSDRVQSGQFGACMMADPTLVGRCVDAMQAATSIPITVKCRIGIDEQSIHEPLDQFITTVAEAGCDTFYVHARKAWLSGLSPKENRTVPPLHYDRVHTLKSDFPHLTIAINGGIETLDDCKAHLVLVDGVMLGRAAYHTPALLLEVDDVVFGDQAETSMEVAIEEMAPYALAEQQKGVPLHRLTKPLVGAYQGQPGAKAWRRMMTMEAQKYDGPADRFISEALERRTPLLTAA